MGEPIAPGTTHIERAEPGVVILSLLGEHDLSTSHLLEEELCLLLETMNVVVDLRQTQFLDSSVISVLARSRERAERHRHKIALLYGSENLVARAVEIACLHDIFPCSDGQDSALQLAREVQQVTPPGRQTTMGVLRLPASEMSLAKARRFLRSEFLSLGMDGRTDDAVLAGNEAVANAARHAYPHGEGEVEIAVAPTGEGAALFVRDEGRGPGPWEDTRGPGLGTKLMHHCSDSVAINGRRAGGTEVILGFKHLPE